MSIVYCIRHAQPNYANKDDIRRELTPKGVLQSQNLVQAFLGVDIELFFSSPHKRAVDTLLPLARHYNKSIKTIDDFCERKIGTWVDDFDAFSQKQWQDFDYRLPQGESLNTVQIRNINALNALLAKHPKQSMAIGTHGTALSTIIHYYDPSFGFEGFCDNKDKFPWVIVFEFDGLKLKYYRQMRI